MQKNPDYEMWKEQIFLSRIGEDPDWPRFTVFCACPLRQQLGDDVTETLSTYNLKDPRTSDGK